MERSRPSREDYDEFFGSVDRVTDLLTAERTHLTSTRVALEQLVSAWPEGISPEMSASADTLASASLSGGGHPCGSLKCRAQRAREGARFAALYADHIRIRDPFERLAHHTLDETGFVEEARAAVAVCLQWKELLTAGIASHLAPICPKCATAVISNTACLSDPVSTLVAEISKEFAETSEAVVCRETGDLILIEYTMPPRYMGHRQLNLVLGDKSRKKYAKFLGNRKRRKVSAKDVARFNVFRPMWAPHVEEALVQAIHRDVLGGPYVSDLQMDLDIAAKSATGEARNAARLLRALRHTVPVVEDVPLSRVLRIREDDDGSFELYRNRIARIGSQLNDEGSLRAAADELKSEFVVLENRIASRKKSVWGGLRDQVTIATGTVTTGLAAWLSGALSPTWSAVVAAAGGVPAVQRALGDALSGRRPRLEEMQHPLYFFGR
jgi:hypothetical protein